MINSLGPESHYSPGSCLLYNWVVMMSFWLSWHLEAPTMLSVLDLHYVTNKIIPITIEEDIFLQIMCGAQG